MADGQTGQERTEETAKQQPQQKEDKQEEQEGEGGRWAYSLREQGPRGGGRGRGGAAAALTDARWDRAEEEDDI